jgi:hypothetical protein
MSNPRYAADREQRRLDGATTNPNSTPVGKGRQQAAQEMQAEPTGAAPSITPRLDRNPARNNAVAVATANRNGAFGTGAQNLQGRRDLFQEMGSSKNFDTPEFKARAQALGVTESGWATAARKLSPSWGTGAAAPATVAAAPAITPAAPRQPAQNALAANAPLPNPSPAAPLPGQAEAGAISPLPQGQATTPTATLPDKVANGGTSTPRNKPSFINQAKNWLANYLMRP